MAFVDVIDDGPGISADEVGRIFERFYRGSRTGTAGAGRGIGLTIARSLARAHGGDVVVESEGPGADVPLDGSRVGPTGCRGLGLQELN